MSSFNIREISSPAVLDAEARRIRRAADDERDIEWFTNDVMKSVNITLRGRVALASEFIRSKVVYNISRPVTKTLITSITGTSSGGTRNRYHVLITNRSLPGEYPKADTTLLMRTIFTHVVSITPDIHDGYIGTPIDYGLILETQMNRSFLKRTFFENWVKMVAIVKGPFI